MVFDAIREGLLCNPDELETLCKSCHKKHTEAEKNNRTIQTQGKAV